MYSKVVFKSVTSNIKKAIIKSGRKAKKSNYGKTRTQSHYMLNAVLHYSSELDKTMVDESHKIQNL